MHEANPVATPCYRSSGVTEDTVGSHVSYRAVLGCQLYLMTGTRPDIAFSVSRADWAWIDQPRQAGLTSNVSSSICGERATMVSRLELAKLREFQKRSAMPSLQVTSDKRVNKRRGGCLCR